MAEPAIGKAVARGATTLAGVTILLKVLATLGQFVIAVYVADTEFGLWALALSLADMFGLVQKLGIREVVTHRQKRIDEWVNSAFWASAIFAVVTVLIIAAIAPFMPDLLHSDERLTVLLIVAGFGVASSGFAELFQAKLSLDFRFGLIAKVSAAEGVVRVVAQVILSILGMGALGLVLARTVTWILQVVVYGIAARPAIKRSPELRLWREAASDSGHIILTRLAEVLIRRGDVILLGMFATDAVVGVYYFAYNLSTQVIMLLSQSIMGVLSAGFSKLQDDLERLRAAFFTSIRVMSFISVPLLVIQAATCGPLLRLLYVDKWESAVVPLQILSVASCFSAAGWNTTAVFTARGLFRRQLVVRVVGGVLFLAVMISAAMTGDPVALASGALLFQAVYVPLQITTATGGGFRAIRESVLSVLRPFVVAGSGALLAIWLTHLVDPQLTMLASHAGEHAGRMAEFLRFFVIGTISSVWYWAGARLVLRGTYGEFAQRMRTVLPARMSMRIPGWML